MIEPAFVNLLFEYNTLTPLGNNESFPTNICSFPSYVTVKSLKLDLNPLISYVALLITKSYSISLESLLFHIVLFLSFNDNDTL